jgi:hypothetical protein
VKIALYQLRTALAARRKAIAAFLAPLVVLAVADVAGVDVAPSMVEQIIVALITALAVERTTNR